MMIETRRGSLSKPQRVAHDELDYISGEVVEVPGMHAEIVNWNDEGATGTEIVGPGLYAG